MHRVREVRLGLSYERPGKKKVVKATISNEDELLFYSDKDLCSGTDKNSGGLNKKEMFIPFMEPSQHKQHRLI